MTPVQYGIRWSPDRVFVPTWGTGTVDDLAAANEMANASGGELVYRVDSDAPWRPVSEDSAATGWFLCGMLSGLASREGLPVEDFQAFEDQGVQVGQFVVIDRGHRFRVRVEPC